MIFTDNTYIYIPMGVFAASAEKQAFTREAAYIDIILMADESEGMITTSVELLSKRWSWSYIRTYMFVRRLANKGFCDVSLHDGDVVIIVKGQPQRMV